METIQALLVRVHHKSERGDWKVCELRFKELTDLFGESTFRAAGKIPDSGRDEVLELQGEWETHEKYGRQFAVKEAASAFRNRPPSKKESGVTLTIPMTSAGRGKVNSYWPARRIMKNKPPLGHPESKGNPHPKRRNPKPPSGERMLSDFALRVSFGFQASAFGFLVTRAGLLGHLHQFDFIALRGVDKGDAATIGVKVRTVGILQSQPGEMPAELLKAGIEVFRDRKSKS